MTIPQNTLSAADFEPRQSACGRASTPAAAAMIDRPCTICGGLEQAQIFAANLPPHLESGTLHSQYDVQRQNWWHYRVVECEQCGHRFPNPVFDPATLELSYRHQDHDNSFGLVEASVMATNRAYVNQLARHLPKHRGLHIDIGCDTGQFLRACQPLGFDQQAGLEPSTTSAETARGLMPSAQILNKIFEPSDFEPRAASLISMIHVLDHIYDPKTFIDGIQTTLTSDGVVYCVVHNCRSLLASVSGSQWHPLNLIHYDYYCPDTLRKLFESRGFRVLALQPTINYISADQVAARAPYIPRAFRNVLLKPQLRAILSKSRFRVPLGNISVVAARA